ncbi:10658_t:CDS:2, partial [Gigaspora rosea]
LFLEYSNNNNTLSWDEKVEFELKALKDTTNIWNNSSLDYYAGDKEATQKSLVTTIEPEHKLDTLTRVEQAIEQQTMQGPIVGEAQGADSLQGKQMHETMDQMTLHATAPDIEADSVGTNMNNTEEQAQTTIEPPDEERKQVIMGFSTDTNSTEVEMIVSTVNKLIPSEMHMTDVLDTKDNMLAQQGNSGAPNTPTCTRRNEDLRDKLDTFSPSSKTADRSSALSESPSMETATKAIQPEDVDWLYSEGFKPVINKRSTTLKKNKQTDKSKIQDSEKRPSPYGKKGRGGNPHRQ